MSDIGLKVGIVGGTGSSEAAVPMIACVWGKGGGGNNIALTL